MITEDLRPQAVVFRPEIPGQPVIGSRQLMTEWTTGL
jgi:hypothetical protein